MSFDASVLGTAALQVDNVACRSQFNLRLLPGNHYLRSLYETVWFTVTPEGKFAYESALEGALTGAGTTTLQVNGCQMSFDAAALGVTALTLDGTSHESAQFSTRLLPGQHYLRNLYETVWFTVTAEGQFAYDAALEGALTGAGTANLTVGGCAVIFDATALGPTTLTLDNVAHDARQAFHLQLLPGWHYFSTVQVQGWVQVLANGTLDYDPSLNGLLSGRGTRQLVLLPA